MANQNYPPDPYNGWYYNGLGNHTASEIMTDTSGRYQMVADYGYIRFYSDHSWGN